MDRQIFFIIAGLLLSVNLLTVTPQDAVYPGIINDGPYIYNQNRNLKIKWIKNGHLKEDSVTEENFDEIKNQFGLVFDFNDLNNIFLLKPDYRHIYKRVDSIAVLSDLHGAYSTYTCLLKAMGVVDSELNWKFGSGHFVILGDVFDRGDMVTEVLWHLFGLEKQAARAGGMVHMLLGNHEFMVLCQKDLRYINQKYRMVEKITGTGYDDLFSYNYVLGRWLRTRPALISINDKIFIHGGISMEMVNREIDFSRANRSFSNIMAGNKVKSVFEADEFKFLSGDLGPIWYRGYFTDRGFTESRLDSILVYYGKSHIIAGHTTFKEIWPVFNNKIFGVDSGIGAGNPGEFLMIKDGIFYRGDHTGKRVRLPE